MYKLAFVFSIFGLVLSATVPEGNVSPTNFSEDGTNTSQLFTFKSLPDGTPLQQCQCKEFHLCDRNDVYDPSLNQDWIRCANQVHVCCILKNKEFNDNTSTSVPDNTSPPNNLPLADSPGQPVDATKKINSSPDDSSKTCSCVPLAKCSDEGYVVNYGQGIVGVLVRVNGNQQCDTSEVCCPDAYIKNEDTKTGIPAVPAEPESIKPSPPPVSVEHPTEPVTPVPASVTIPVETSSIPVQSVTTASDVEELFIPTQAPQSQCSCVPIDSCKNDSIADNHGGGVIQLRAPLCDVTEVCCLVSDLIAASAPVSSEASARGNSTDTSSDQECGLRKGAITRVSGTDDSTYTDFGEFPWMMVILKKHSETEKPKMICGGSLVSSNMVLTAAHCVHKIDQEKLIVRAGEYDFELDAGHEAQPHQDRSVHDIRIHPFYRDGVVFNDMALLILDEEFELKSYISPICLPVMNSKFADPKIYDPTKCIATGWGKEVHGDTGTFQNTLKKVDLSLVDHHECEKRLRETKLGPRFMLHSSFICAGGEIGKDTCQGDGGGPLFCALRDKPDRYVQVGITSWGVDCGQQLPAVYTNVKANAKWLTVEINMSTIFARHAGKSRAKSHKQKQK